MTAMTLSDAAQALHPPMPRRELARRMESVAPAGAAYARRGRRARTYPVSELMRAHAAWVAERLVADRDSVCQNSAQEESDHER
jgi:hypothetical protein